MDRIEEDVNQLLTRLAAGDESASARLLPIVYEELRARAEQIMGRSEGQTLQPTALVHEAWLKLAGTGGPTYESRGHFVAVCAKAMRQILVDNARRRAARRRREERVTIHGVDSEAAGAIDVVDLGEALAALETEHPRVAQVAELRLFGGLEVAQVAAVLGRSRSTTFDDWRIARAWLRRAMTGPGSS